MKDCQFCKIVAKQTTDKIFYEDEDIIVFEPKEPKAPFHLLLVPKKHVEELGEAEDMIVLSIKKKIAQIVGEKWLIDKPTAH
jgi:histidine triad (HIT) family protein